MRYLVVHAHPSPSSFSRALCDRAVAALTAAGHDVELIDLYAERFEARLSREERLSYESDEPILDPQIRRYADLVLGCAGLVFIYPTWWSGAPAILKGWLERVLVPGVSFTLDPLTHKVQPGFGHVRRIVGITTYGSPRWNVWLMADGGRRLILRCVRILAPRLRCRSRWLALYDVDRSTDEQRQAFLQRVEKTMAAL